MLFKNKASNLETQKHTKRIDIDQSQILIKGLPPYIMKWIGLLMSEYYNRHNRLAYDLLFPKRFAKM